MQVTIVDVISFRNMVNVRVVFFLILIKNKKYIKLHSFRGCCKNQRRKQKVKGLRKTQNRKEKQKLEPNPISPRLASVL